MVKQKLPIYAFCDQIVETVRDNAVTVITAQTGAGKSTQVPQYLLEAGYTMVVTQPRRLAARTLAERVSSERGEVLGGIVGFRTAHERRDSDQTRCLFVTDGLALVRELVGVNTCQVLIIDEVHEWNLNVEVLIAWARLQIERGVQFKLVIMSATMDARKVAAFYGEKTPVIEVPGRLFEITVKQPRRLVEDTVHLLNCGHNVLVFQPGKAEIGETLKEVQQWPGQWACTYPAFLSLHGEMEPEEQARCFRHYDSPKCIVATNVAQTSVTIDDIDAVVDSGMERRKELVDGVEGIYIKPISFADAEQRKGRAGRTKRGVYIDHCPANPADRLEFPKAEILRSRLDQVVLRLAEAGFDAEELEFFHQPDKAEIHEAKRALKALGCMDEVGHVTAIGHRVAKMPISVKYGRMIIEAERLGVVDDVITVAAVLEVGGITDRNFNGWKFQIVQKEKESDVMAQLAVYRWAHTKDKDELRKMGIHLKNYFRTKETRRHLTDSLVGKVRSFESSGNREDILRAVCAGMVDHLYHGYGQSYTNGDLHPRQLAKESVVYGPEWIVGVPFDIQIKGRYDEAFTLRLVRMVTKVDPLWLAEVAPQLVRVETTGDAKFDLGQGVVLENRSTMFQNHIISEEWVPVYSHSRTQELKAQAMEKQERQRLLALKSQLNADMSLNTLGLSYQLEFDMWDHIRSVPLSYTNPSLEVLRSWVLRAESLLERAKAEREARRVASQPAPKALPVPVVPKSAVTLDALAEKWGGRFKK